MKGKLWSWFDKHVLTIYTLELADRTLLIVCCINSRVGTFTHVQNNFDYFEQFLAYYDLGPIVERPLGLLIS